LPRERDWKQVSSSLKISMRAIRTTCVVLAVTVFSGGISERALFGESLDQIEDLIETGHADSAAVLLEVFLAGDPETIERIRGNYLMSRAMNQLGKLSDEIRHLNRAREESAGTQFEGIIVRDYARIMFQTGNYDECITIAEKYRELAPDLPFRSVILSISADALYAKGEYRRAFNLYSELSTFEPDTETGAHAVLRAGLCLHHLGLVGGAIERLEEYLARYPDGSGTAEALWRLGESYESIHNTRLALETFQRLVVEYPSTAGIIDIYFKLGENYLKMGQLVEAENAFLNYSINADTTTIQYGEALLNLERINYRNGSYPNEIAMYENYISRYPASPLVPSILFDLARYYTTAGRYEQALEQYSILTVNPRYRASADSAAFLMADLFTDMGDSSRAVSSLIDAASSITELPRVQKYYLKLGSLYELWDDPDIAIFWYDRVYTKGGSPILRARALMAIGAILKAHDRRLEAENMYERIIAEFPDNPYRKEVFLALSDIYYLSGDVAKTIQTAERAVKFAEGVEKNKILVYIAELYEELDEQHALRLYSMVFNSPESSRPLKTDALLKYGDLALRIGERSKAVSAYVAVIEDSADSNAVLKAREKLSTITDR
jgi:tetratricopeptide (TPR) repeat protein